MGVTIPQSIKLQMARIEALTASGIATAKLKVPGTPGQDNRVIAGGSGAFANQAAGDWVKVEVRDDDNILGGDAGALVDSFADLSVPAGNQGWYFLGSGPINIGTLIPGDPAELPSGLWLHIIGTKVSGEDTLYVNINWGQRI
jgi:hypothetical protein